MKIKWKDWLELKTVIDYMLSPDPTPPVLQPQPPPPPPALDPYTEVNDNNSLVTEPDSSQYMEILDPFMLDESLVEIPSYTTGS